MRLSGASERLLPEARAVLAAAHRTRQVAADIRAGTDGVLRLGIVQGPGDRIYRALNELAAVAPRLQVRPRRLPLPARLSAVRSGEFDAALVRALADAPGLELLPIWTDPLYAALPAGHRLTRAAELRLEDLADLPLGSPHVRTTRPSRTWSPTPAGRRRSPRPPGRRSRPSRRPCPTSASAPRRGRCSTRSPACQRSPGSPSARWRGSR
ncbi:LysR substrate-binding domain-containing protein [Streptosporangium sp. NPDC049644]|uniref:LysR substrate-binding domain-containing protein n=1 Tax=Streptosporangium sp. NPDC049644 TaxID=3155507 RepID=UPI00343F37FC